jgi:outer membrane murein-binding lipoprotein Lpp
MNALQRHPEPIPARPTPTPRRRARSHSKQRPSAHQVALFESGLKLSINLILIAAAGTTLATLIPYNLRQRAALEQLQSEVKEVDGKVAQLEEDLGRNFDPQQALNVMQEQNIRFDPRQKQVVWLNAEPQTLPKSAEIKQAESLDAP